MKSVYDIKQKREDYRMLLMNAYYGARHNKVSPRGVIQIIENKIKYLTEQDCQQIINEINTFDKYDDYDRKAWNEFKETLKEQIKNERK